MRVNKSTVDTAWMNLLNRITPQDVLVHGNFIKIMGITMSQWIKFKQTGRMHTSKITAAKLKAAAKYGDSPHWYTIIKAAAAKERECER